MRPPNQICGTHAPHRRCVEPVRVRACGPRSTSGATPRQLVGSARPSKGRRTDPKITPRRARACTGWSLEPFGPHERGVGAESASGLVGLGFGESVALPAAHGAARHPDLFSEASSADWCHTSQRTERVRALRVHAAAFASTGASPPPADSTSPVLGLVERMKSAAAWAWLATDNKVSGLAPMIRSHEPSNRRWR